MFRTKYEATVQMLLDAAFEAQVGAEIFHQLTAETEAKERFKHLSDAARNLFAKIGLVVHLAEPLSADADDSQWRDRLNVL